MPAREEKARRQRESIIKAAVTVFSKKGFHQASVEEIAKKAGVGKGTIYLYFKDKPDLFGAAVSEGVERFIEKLRSELVSDLPFLRHFRQLVDTSVSYYLDCGELTAIFNNELSSGLDPRTRRRIDQARDQVLDFFAEILADGHRRGYIREIDFRLASVGLLGLLDSMCGHQLKSGKADKQAIFDTVHALLTAGLIQVRG